MKVISVFLETKGGEGFKKKMSSVGLQKGPKLSVTWHSIHDLCIQRGLHMNTDVKIISYREHSFSHETTVSMTPKRRLLHPNLQNLPTATSADVSETMDYIFSKTVFIHGDL